MKTCINAASLKCVRKGLTFGRAAAVARFPGISRRFRIHHLGVVVVTASNNLDITVHTDPAVVCGNQTTVVELPFQTVIFVTQLQTWNSFGAQCCVRYELYQDVLSE